MADAVRYSYEQTASIEQGRRPAKAPLTEQAEDLLGRPGVGGVAGASGPGAAAHVLPRLRDA
ncbi:hypothetical protein [Streptomyces sp. NPDC026589]|uniref:hypothetical protein n=1 Tax=Streptomyces sp. NPDC026589 TaxID=3155609 RepID=UPI0033DBC16A